MRSTFVCNNSLSRQLTTNINQVVNWKLVFAREIWSLRAQRKQLSSLAVKEFLMPTCSLSSA